MLKHAMLHHLRTQITAAYWLHINEEQDKVGAALLTRQWHRVIGTRCGAQVRPFLPGMNNVTGIISATVLHC